MVGKRGWVKRGGEKEERLSVEKGKVKGGKRGRFKGGGKRGREGVSMFKGGKRDVCELRKSVWV